MPRPSVLFLCTHNSARSQMAEGLLRAMAGDRYEALSAGTVPAGVRPEAVAAMAELGIDIGQAQSKTLDRYLGRPIDWVITVCDDAREACPLLPGAGSQLHWSIPDPAAVEGDSRSRMEAFRAARDDLARRIRAFVVERERGSA